MLTRGHVLISRPKDEVFDAALQTLKAMGAKIKKEDRSVYYIQSKTTTIWNARIGGSKLEIFVRGEHDDSILDVYDHFTNLGSADARFLNRFFQVFSNYIPLTSSYGIEAVKEIVTQRDPNLICTVCTRQAYSFSLQKGIEKLCRTCFVQKFGNVLLATPNAQYYGGHKAYLAGGVFSQSQIGSLVMTEKHLLFQTNDKDITKRWEMLIPFKEVVVSEWNVEEVTRRKQMSGVGGLVDVNQDGQGDIAAGGGFIHESGKGHHLVVPYIDQNGIPQQPRFGVSSLGGKAIREWSAKLYERVVEAKQEMEAYKQNELQQKSILSEGISSPAGRGSNEDPVYILKIRLAKGEITKEQYDELRQALES